MCVFRFLRGKKKISHVLVRNVAPKPTQFPGNADPNEPLGLYAVQDDVEVHLRSSQGILESWPERLQFLIYDIYDCFSCRMCIWYDLLSLSVWFSLSLYLFVYISAHALTQTDGSRFQSIDRAFENAPYWYLWAASWDFIVRTCWGTFSVCALLLLGSLYINCL